VRRATTFGTVGQFGTEHRGLLGTSSGSLFLAGSAMWLTTSLPLRIIGAGMALLGFLIFTSLMWGWPFAALRIHGTPPQQELHYHQHFHTHISGTGAQQGTTTDSVVVVQETPGLWLRPPPQTGVTGPPPPPQGTP